jgi:Putative GTPases (G3E family)
MTNVEKKIPVNILTGFLGSGKTTLLKRLLAENQGQRKIAILMNEIGEISIDAKLIEGFSVEVFELNDGCICCTVNENFVQVLDEVSTKLSPDLLVIETTGVADPLSIIYSLINPNVVLDAVITTVDAKNFLKVKMMWKSGASKLKPLM